MDTAETSRPSSSVSEITLMLNEQSPAPAGLKK